MDLIGKRINWAESRIGKPAGREERQRGLPSQFTAKSQICLQSKHRMLAGGLGNPSSHTDWPANLTILITNRSFKKTGSVSRRGEKSASEDCRASLRQKARSVCNQNTECWQAGSAIPAPTPTGPRAYRSFHKTDPSIVKQHFYPNSFITVVMIYRLLIFLLIFAGCQRKTVPDQGKVIEVDIDTTITLLSNKEIPANAVKDIHHLLELSYKKANREYDSIRFQMYFDAEMKDSIRIQSTGNDTVFLTIGNKNNKTVALYSYLDLLGFRFYGPEDHWVFIPQLDRIYPLDTLLHSYFSIRSLWPTFGVGRHNISALDTTMYLYSRWMNRLRMADLHNVPTSHYGSQFNKKYKKQIIAHPSWRGKNSKGEIKNWSPTLKLCYLNPDVIALYKKDALARLEVKNKISPPPYFINMEPPDGYGFCKSALSEKSVSDQVYGLANEVAQYLIDHDSNAIITLYGYNQHAAAPTFPLSNNMLIGIVPYAFQSVGSPEKMMEEWENSGVKLYLRDYMAIPVWQYDRPAFHPNGSFLQKLNHIRKAEYFGYKFETTASFMAVGLQFYLLSKASWEDTDGAKEYQTFLQTMFPGYEQEVSLIYENLPILDKNTFADALNRVRQLKTSRELEKDQQLFQRMKDLEFYIEYLYLLDRFQTDKNEQNKEILLDKIMSEPGSRLLHPYGLYRTLKSNSKITRPIKRTKNASVQDMEVKSPLTLRRKVKMRYAVANPNFYLDSVSSFTTFPLRNTRGILYVADNHEAKVKFRAKLKHLNSSASGVVIVRDMDDVHIKDIKLTPDNKWHDYEFKLNPGNHYKIQFRTPGSELFFQGPNRPFAFSEELYTRYIYHPVSFYFRAPDDKRDVKIQIPRKSNKVVVKSDDQILYTRDQNDPYVLDITGQEGHIIEVIMYRHGLKLLNIPQLLALHKEGVIYQIQE